MANIKNILFPFDFSTPGMLAARFVRTVAERNEAKVTLISIVPPVWSIPPAGIPAVVPVEAEKMSAQLQEHLDGALKDEFAGLNVARIGDRGDPAERIVRYAHANAIDLIMMPTHGLGAFRSFLIGSVTAKVLHDAECPVWTATHAEEQHAADSPKTVVCAVDTTDQSAGLMRWAADFAQRLGGSLKLVHVVPPISDWLTLTSERELQEQVREAARTNVQSLMRSAGIEAPLRVAVGKISDTVTEEARQEGADLVIIGRGALRSAFGRLRTHAYGIIQTSPCPVISV